MLTGVRGALQAVVVVGLFRCFPTTVNITLFVQTGIGAKAPMRLPIGLLGRLSGNRHLSIS
jgi:hypothetical protein